MVHHQNKCMLFLVKWIQFDQERKTMHAIVFSVATQLFSQFAIQSVYDNLTSRPFPPPVLIIPVCIFRRRRHGIPTACAVMSCNIRLTEMRYTCMRNNFHWPVLNKMINAAFQTLWPPNFEQTGTLWLFIGLGTASTFTFIHCKNTRVTLTTF